MEFESILKEAGEFGKYQKSLVFKFMVPTTFASAFYVLNVIFMVATPDHWCYVPELASMNLTEFEMKNIAIPKLNDGSYAKCAMYNQNYSALISQFKSTGKFPEIKINGKIIPKRPESKCTHGWVYQKDWYEETIVSKWDLVCDRNYLPSLVLTFANAGSVIGTFCFSTMADKQGRKTAFLANLYVAVVSGVLSIFSPTFAVFAVLRALTGSTVPSNFQIPYIITIEQVGSRQRAWLVCISWTLWTLGACCLALVAYATRHWCTLGLVTTIPIAAFFAYRSFLKPSPRYLMAQGRCEEAAEVIKVIAERNGCKVPKSLLSRLQEIAEKDKPQNESDTEISALTFFKYPQLRKKLLIVTLNWSAIAVAYFGLTLNATNLGKNDFLNFFLLSAVELPAFPLALVLMEKIGRRWSTTIFVLLTGTACLIPSFFTKAVDMGSSAIVISMIGKFGSAAAFTVIYQQAAELYPTPVRALGMGIGSVVSSVAVICMPYICYLGIYNKAIPFLIIGALCVSAGLTAPLVPETVRKTLPQTIKDSEEFGLGKGCFPCCGYDEGKDDNDPENAEGAENVR